MTRHSLFFYFVILEFTYCVNTIENQRIRKWKKVLHVGHFFTLSTITFSMLKDHNIHSTVKYIYSVLRVVRERVGSAACRGHVTIWRFACVSNQYFSSLYNRKVRGSAYDARLSIVFCQTTSLQSPIVPTDLMSQTSAIGMIVTIQSINYLPVFLSISLYTYISRICLALSPLILHKKKTFYAFDKKNYNKLHQVDLGWKVEPIF